MTATTATARAQGCCWRAWRARPRGSRGQQRLTLARTTLASRYRQLPPTRLKGLANEANLFEPLREAETNQRGGSVGKQGRDLEYGVLKGMLAELITYHGGGCLVLLGNRGSGKNVLVDALVEFAGSARMKVMLSKNVAGKAKEGAATEVDEGGRTAVCRPLYIVASGQRVFGSDPVRGLSEATRAAEPSTLGDRSHSTRATGVSHEPTPDEVEHAEHAPAFGAWAPIVARLLTEAAAADGTSETAFVLSALEYDRKVVCGELPDSSAASERDSTASVGPDRFSVTLNAHGGATHDADARHHASILEARREGLVSLAWLLNDVLPDSHAPLDVPRPTDAEERMHDVGWLLVAMICALLAHYRRGRGRRLMCLLHLQTGSDRDSHVDVWSWRMAVAVAVDVRLRLIPQFVLVIASRQLSLVHEMRSSWLTRLNKVIETNFQELCTEVRPRIASAERAFGRLPITPRGAPEEPCSRSRVP